MSHRGSLLCLPSGIWPSEITTPTQIEDVSFALVWDEQPAVDHCLIGTGRDPWIIPRVLHELFREHHIVVEAMTTGAAVRTYNILLSESRRIAALLIVVD
jgi:uncharacterized protein